MHNKTALIPEGSNGRQGQKFLTWEKSALATAAALALFGVSFNANALALGAIQVKSALGEALRAEIEVPEISSEEASTLQVALGSQQAFQAAGVDYSSALRGTTVSLHRRPNGQAYLRVRGNTSVNEPFLGIVIEASWASGHIVRDYTMLIDPPGQPVATTQPQTIPSVAEQTTAPSVRVRPTRPGAASESAAVSNGLATPGDGQVRVQRGDTASAIARAHMPEGVSLDQMLVAIQRANPHAFIHGNVNLIRAGAVVNLPSAEQASTASPASARRTVIAQSRDFQAYRQGLAMTASHGTQIAAANSRSATGSVQPQVQEAGTVPAPQDRLTISRGGQPGNAMAAGHSETSVEQSRHAQEQAGRTAELNRNISELSKLAAEGSNATPAATASPVKPSAPAINVPLPAGVTAATGALAASTAAVALNAAAASAAASAASAEATSTATVPAAASHRQPIRRPMVLPPPQPSLWDTLLGNPLIVSGVVAVLALLGIYGLLRSKQKKKINASPNSITSSVFTESKIQPDSFFGGSGGQRVDTRESGNATETSSSMAYSPSQLEAAGDVDPVAEADVYLAYGRDIQAEEILKEALHTSPKRLSIYHKLAEIYVKRRDSHALKAVALEVHQLTHGEGQDWLSITSLGAQLDPNEPLYQSSGAATAQAVSAMPAQQPQHLQAAALGADTQPQELSVPPIDNKSFSLDMDLSHNASILSQRDVLSPAASQPLPAASEIKPLSTEIDTARVPLNIDFTPPAPGSAVGTTQPDDDRDPLSTKLALAQEFRAIGDKDSARNMIKEVLAEATGPLKAKATQFMNDLD